MKRCPECRKDYVDDSLVYCLDDGAALVQGSVTDEPPTAIISGDRPTDEKTEVLNAGSLQPRSKPITLNLPAFLSRQSLPWTFVAALALVAVVLGYGDFNRSSSASSNAIRLSFEPPADLAFNDKLGDWAVISPDGRRVVFSANQPDGKNMLFVREMNSSEAKVLPGSENPLEPFWSPDSKSVGYGSNGKLKRSDLSGGNAQVLCDSARLVGGSWNDDGVIVFGPDYRTTLVQVSAKGGEPQPVARQSNSERHSSSSGVRVQPHCPQG